MLNKISFSSEKIIWDYFHQMNKYNENIKNIFEIEIDNDEYVFSKKKDKIKINFLDFIEYYIENDTKDYDLKIFYDKIKYDFKTFVLYKSKETVIVKNKKKSQEFNLEMLNKDKYNVTIKEIVKLKSSDTFYILLS